MNLTPLFSGNLPLVVYLLILIVLYLYHTNMVQSIHLHFDILKFVPLMKNFNMRQFNSRKFFSLADILMILLIFKVKSFLIDLSKSLSKVYQTVGKKQLPIILSFLCHLSLETRNRLNSCIKNQLPSCSLRTVFQSKTRLSSLF